MAKHEHDFRDGFDVCVGNYGYYNEGELHDTWMRLPMDPDKIENGELLYCFDFNRYGEIAVNNGYVDLCETCYVDKRADWPALDEYSFEEIRDETVAEWRAHIAEGVVEKPVTPTDLARSASAAAATSAVIAASANQTAPKL